METETIFLFPHVTKELRGIENKPFNSSLLILEDVYIVYKGLMLDENLWPKQLKKDSFEWWISQSEEVEKLN